MKRQGLARRGSSPDARCWEIKGMCSNFCLRTINERLSSFQFLPTILVLIFPPSTSPDLITPPRYLPLALRLRHAFILSTARVRSRLWLAMPALPLRPSGIDILPLEIKSRIASHATIYDTKRLARVSHSWQIAAESHLYERIGFPGKHHPSTYTWESDVEDSFWNYEHQWVKVLEALRARPARARYVRVVQAYPFRENASHVKRILRLCHRNLVDISHQIEWTENCHGEEIETRKDSWLSRAIIRANKPFFNLTSLDLNLASSPFDILLDILRLTPALERLRVRGQGWWQMETKNDAFNDDGEEAGAENVPLKLERLREVMLGFWETTRKRWKPSYPPHLDSQSQDFHPLAVSTRE